MKNKRASVLGIIIILAIIVGLVSLVAFLVWDSSIRTYKIIGTVKSKWIDVGPNGSYYLLRLMDDRMLEVDRSDFYLHINSDIVFDSIKVNETYEFTCWGWEHLWFYWYPNVLEARLIE